MPEWTTVQFHSLADDSKSSFSKPYGSAITKEDYVSNGVPVVRGVNLSKGIFYDDAFVYISDQKADQMPGANLVAGDLVFTHRGTIGQVSMVPRHPRYPRYVLSTSHVKARLDPKQALPEFYYYWFSSPDGQQRILAHISTVGVPGLAQPVATIKSLSVPLPPFAVQEAISNLLGALDDKIAVNDRIVATSNDLALACGHQALGAEPGPKVSMANCVQVIKGASYRSDDLTGDKGVLISLKCVGRDGQFRIGGVKPFNGECKPEQVLHEGDIVVAQTDLTQRAEVIGKPSRVLNLGGWGRMVASLDLAVVRPQGGLTREVLFAVLSSRQFHDHALSHCNGTTVLHMSARALPTFRFGKPSDNVIARVTATMHPLFARSDQASRESQSLAGLRDALLPKLMSGEIRVREAERVVGDAT